MLRLNGVTHIDTTVLEEFAAFCKTVTESGRVVVLSGLHMDITEKFEKAGIIEIIGENSVFMAKDYVLESSNIAINTVKERINNKYQERMF